MTDDRFRWIRIFKSRHLKDVIYLVVFIVIIIVGYLKVEAAMANKYASSDSVLRLEFKQQENEGELGTISHNLKRLVWNAGLEWQEVR